MAPDLSLLLQLRHLLRVLQSMNSMTICSFCRIDYNFTGSSSRSFARSIYRPFTGNAVMSPLELHAGYSAGRFLEQCTGFDRDAAYATGIIAKKSLNNCISGICFATTEGLLLSLYLGRRFLPGMRCLLHPNLISDCYCRGEPAV